MLTFISTAGTVNGFNANIDENTIYKLNQVYELKENVEAMDSVIGNLSLEIKEKKDNIQYFNEKEYQDNIEEMKKLTEELKFHNGFSDVRGQGIMLKVSDNIESEDMPVMQRIVHDLDITTLLNDLKSAGAEAIEVNGKRVTSISEVVCAGPILRINGEAVSAPFVIRAVGNMEDLYEMMTKEGSYAYNLKNTYGMGVEVRMSYNLYIPKFYEDNYSKKFKYSKIAMDLESSDNISNKN